MFRRARIKLTIYYMAIFTAILLVFTYLTFEAKESAFVRVSTVVSQYDTQGREALELNNRLDDYTKRFRERILLFDLVLWIIAARLSWALSGTTLRPIKAMLREQKAFVADVSHGLRTPLTTISLEVEAFKRTAQPEPKTTKLLDSLLDEVAYLTRITEGVLSLTRSDQMGQAKQAIEIDSLASEVVRQMRPQAKTKKQLIVIRKMKAKVWVNEDQIKQVMTILLDNAIKYANLKSKIIVGVVADKSRIRLTVSDDGPGITPEELPHIFERFERGKDASLKAVGAGLGLAVAKKIIQAHEGKLSVKSQIGVGTTFTISLPRIS